MKLRREKEEKANHLIVIKLFTVALVRRTSHIK